MHDRWLGSTYITRALLVCALLLLVIAEAVVIVGFVGSPKLHSSLALGYLLGIVLVTSIPGAAGIKGYQVVSKMRPALDAQSERKAVIWLSRQFLATAVAGYAAIIVIVVFLTELLRAK
ncbi:MAG TPA: hypothetical protein VN861_02190 [Candidatus Acidoferrales bacterium]|jgi:hypothetical protein|nr:hypothetical protein [Candidatus Acidoferrales bacterium]